VIVLVVAAHPDDEVLGAGATLARHVDAGDEVHAVVVAEGASSRYEPEMVDILHDCGRSAAEVLGLASIRFEAFPDQRLDREALIDVTQRLEETVSTLRPDVVYTHFAHDANTDHGVVARCAWTACRPYTLPGLRLFAAFETPSSTEWMLPGGAQGFAPTRYVDVTETLERKIEAMERYKTELRDYPHPRSSRALRERAAFWGSHVARRAAEPFVVLRETW
jgi:LmbE family N-acetylglucosaminyl deacetylase